MQTMKAAILTAPSKVEVKSVALPQPNPWQALVKLEFCGVCSGTDTKLLHGRPPCSLAYPAMLGHEGVGEVVALGERVKAYKVGDRVLRPCAIYPGQEQDGVSSNWGSLSEFALVTDLEAWQSDEPSGAWSKYSYARMQQVVPQSVAPQEACMLITWKETFSSLKLLDPIAGASVAVLGDGGVGLSFAQWARTLAAKDVTVLGRRKGRLERATKMGANRVIDTRNEALPTERVFDVVVDTIGSSASIQSMLPALKDKGRIGVYGLSESWNVEFDRSLAPRVWSYIQCNPDEAGCHREVVELITRHRFSAGDYLTCIKPLDRIAEAFEHLASGDSLKSAISFT
jgi:D-arabinose 1-dehydrogenase-like Zn-dependent alcohol dehydrogenase